MEYVHPNYVLTRDDVTLQSVTPTHAVFAVTPHTNVNDPRSVPFIFMGQYTEATELVLMPLESMHRLAREMRENGQETMEMVLIGNSAR